MLWYGYIMKKKDYCIDDRYKYTIPGRMQAFRKNNRISQKEMGKRLGVSTTYVSNIERGINKLPVWFLDRYCKELGIPVDVVLRDKDETQDLAGKIADKVRKLPAASQQILDKIVDAFSDENINNH